MKRVLIVDDETIVRITLRSLIDWESFGYQVVADAVHGKQALAYLESCPMDLVITDMKMPVMDGLGLIEEIHRRGMFPQILVLSGYDDFKLVREAFRMGAADYLLKADLDAQMLESALSGLKQKEMEETDRGVSGEGRDELGRGLTGEAGADSGRDQTGGAGQEGGRPGPTAGWAPASSWEPAKQPKGEAGRAKGRRNGYDFGYLADMAMGKREIDESIFTGDYVVIQFEIEDYIKHGARFSENPREELVQPFLSFANQIPRVASRCVMGSISPSRYVMLYFIADSRVYQENVASTCRQLCSVWKNYMNLPVSAGASHREGDPKAFMDRLEEAGEYLKLRYLRGRAAICVPWEKKQVSYGQAEAAGEQYQKLIQALFIGDELAVEEEKSSLFASLYQMELPQAVSVSLCLICCLAWKFEENHDDLRTMFSDEIDYYKKLERFEEIRELELWLNNYFRWVLDYQSSRQDKSQKDMIMRAKRFIMDNYSNPELTLGSVAGYVGLNEKYFSSRFTKEEGMTFSNYLTEVRIRKARELMDQTNLKIYEVSQNVGYNSVEHFTRVFKKICKVSPGSYRR